MARVSVKESAPETHVQATPENSPPNAALKSTVAKNKTTIIFMLGLALIVGLFLFLLNDRKELKQQVTELSSDTQTKADDEAVALKSEIGKYLELPDEVPTVATVEDASKVKNQTFFANAQNGDKVLLFSKAGKAVLYRPSTKKIIEVAPINLNNQQNGTNGTAPSSP